jgi:hypothetical protein
MNLKNKIHGQQRVNAKIRNLFKGNVQDRALAGQEGWQ